MPKVLVEGVVPPVNRVVGELTCNGLPGIDDGCGARLLVYEADVHAPSNGGKTCYFGLVFLIELHDAAITCPSCAAETQFDLYMRRTSTTNSSQV